MGSSAEDAFTLATSTRPPCRVLSLRGELDELAGLYEANGLTPATARQVAVELTGHDVLAAHLSAELNIDELEVVNPWHAALASAAAFAAGAVLPLLAILLLPKEVRIPLTFVAVLVALTITGAVSAHVGGSSRRRAMLRLVLGADIERHGDTAVVHARNGRVPSR